MSSLVSIVLPVFNGEKYLSDSINSILSQTYNNWELIIVNDCSTDGTEKIIEEYCSKDKRIRYYKNDKNLKLPASLNVGFSHAEGEYLTWTSDDNIFHQDALEKMCEFLTGKPEVDMVYCDYNCIDPDGNIIGHEKVLDIQYIYFGNVIRACFMYRRSVANEIGDYSEKYFLAEDYEYWLRINLAFNIQPLHECLYDYRIHLSSLTSTRKKEIDRITGNLKWNYLRTHEKVITDKQMLYSYFDSLLYYKEKPIERWGNMFIFGIRHPKYFVSIIQRFVLKRILNR